MTVEKRGSGRLPARSPVELSYGRKLGARRIGELLNVGRGGFRVRHHDARIHAGKLVAFRHQFAEGFARVTWTKLRGDSFESGFENIDSFTSSTGSGAILRQPPSAAAG